MLIFPGTRRSQYWNLLSLNFLFYVDYLINFYNHLLGSLFIPFYGKIETIIPFADPLLSVHKSYQKGFHLL